MQQSPGQGVEESIIFVSTGTAPTPAPGLGVETSNRALLSAVHSNCDGVSKWNAFEAPVPNGTQRKFMQLLTTHKFFPTWDKSILMDRGSWDWGHPTWLISGVSADVTRKAFQKS